MAIALNDDEESGQASESDQEGNFIAFNAKAVVGESEIVEENPSNRELSENADLQKVYNKLCKITAKDVINVDLGLKKIDTLDMKRKIFWSNCLMLMNL